LAINGAAAIYTLPFDLPSPNIGSLAALLPSRGETAAKPDPIVAALKDIQSAQQQQAASLQEINSSLQQNAALRQQDSTTLVSLRQSITDERGDVKKISPQLSTLIAKIDSLQSTMTSDLTSSIRRAHARYGLSAAMRKRMVRQSKSTGPVSVGGAPLTVPATVAGPES
jgi:chromosome segregation ATPase